MFQKKNLNTHTAMDVYYLSVKFHGEIHFYACYTKITELCIFSTCTINNKST